MESKKERKKERRKNVLQLGVETSKTAHQPQLGKIHELGEVAMIP